MFGNICIMASLLVFLTMTTSCGNDDPDAPDQEEQVPSTPQQPDTPDKPDNPDNPDTPDDPSQNDPNEDDNSKYFTPTEKDFLGAWRAYWVKMETYKCHDNKWSLSETEILDENTAGASDFWGWARYIGFINDDLNPNKLLWEYGAAYLDVINQAIANKESWSMEYGIVLDKGKITGGNYYNWIWYPDANTNVSMLVLKDSKDVQYRWKITQFDGESFTSSPAFYDDFPSNKEGDQKTFYTYKYRRYQRAN